MKRKIIFTLMIILTLFALTTVSATNNSSTAITDVQTVNSDTSSNHISSSDNLIVDSSNSKVSNDNYVDEEINKNTTTTRTTKTVKKDNSNTYYINNSVQNNGDGSKERPWKNMNQSVFSSMSNGSTVYIANGIYRFNNININNITMIGEDMNKTIISTSTSGGYNTLLNLEGNIIIKNITFTNSNTIENHGNSNITNVRFIDSGNSRSSSCIDNYGNLNISNAHFINITSSASIIYNERNDLMNIDNCTFINCETSTSYGGILYLRDSRTNIRNSRFINSSSEKGVIYIRGGTANIHNSTFTSNNVTLYDGGVLNLDESNINITSSNFVDNHAVNNGGAIYSYNSNLVINHSLFTRNSARIGGAIVVVNGSGVGTEFTNTPRSIIVSNSVFNNNSAIYEGGAIFDVYSNLTITSSNFTRNYARNGGGVYADDLRLTITSSVLASNYADSYGGAIYSNQNNLTINNSTFITNSAIYGDDLYSQYNTSCILNGNTWNSDNSVAVNITGNYELPSIIVTNGININTTVLPSKYDLRDYGMVTSVKNQGAEGNCWAFAAIATLESCILKNTNLAYDLSENNLKNLMQLFSQYGWCITPNFGGYDDMAVGYLVNWYGPVTEGLDPYVNDSAISPQLDSILHITNVYGIPSRTSYTDNNLVKEAIMKYGAVFTDIRMAYSGSTTYYTGDDDCNHAVAIVGWDDTYNRTNFATTAPGDGAFIIKNSWGSDSGDKGYYYVSYYDTSILNTCDDLAGVGGFTFILNDTVVYDNIYQYDYGGLSDWVYGSRTPIYSNEYTIKGNETLQSFGTYVSDTSARYTLRVYINNKLNYTQSGYFTHLGYETVKLNRTIPVNTNDSVKIELSLQSSNSDDVGIPVSTAEYTRVVPTSKSLINNEENRTAVAILKLYTTDNNRNNKVTIKADIINNKVNNSTINIRVFSGKNTLTNGTLTIMENNNILSHVNISNSITTIKLPYNTSGEHNILIQYNNLENQTTNTHLTMYIIKTNTNLTVNRISDTQYNNTIAITGKLLDENGNILNNQRITITINNKEYNTTTNNNAIYTLNYKTQTIGTNTITITYNGNNIYNPSTKNIQFNTEKITTKINANISKTIIGENANLSARFTGSNGKILTSGKVAVKINGKTFGHANITNGTISLILKLDPKKFSAKNYKVSFKYGGSSFYTEAELNTTLQIIKHTSKFTYTTITAVKGETTKITVKITDNKNTVNANNGTLGLKINGKTYKINGKAVIVKPVNGIATFTINTSNLQKNNNITFTYSGYREFDGLKQNFNNGLIINNQKTIIQVSQIRAIIGENANITAKFTGADGKILTSGKVAVKINGKTFGHANITNGIISFILKLDPKKFSAKNYTVTFKFGGKEGYTDATANTTLTINKHTSKFNYNTTTATKGTTTRITVKITDDKNTVNANNGTLGLKINGKTYTVNNKAYVVKPANGIATFTINTNNLKTNNNITFTYSGYREFNGGKITINNGLILRN